MASTSKTDAISADRRSEIEWVPAYFNPPLAAERNGWMLNQLRQHSVQTVIDVGCGEGSFLRSLCELSGEKFDPRTPLDPDVSSRPLYPSLLGGLDIDEWEIKSAAERTKCQPFNPNVARYVEGGVPRWDDVRVQLWHGGIEAINPDFIDKYQCFVSSEVVEHVPVEVLDLFLPIILGYYRPELLLLTTPNYAYNELFSPPGVVNATGYPDPTGTTDRVFRHHDHKREWLIDEWRDWCETGAREHGYELLELGSIGSLGRPDPYGRVPEVGGSLTAVFRRVEERERVIPPALRPAECDTPVSSAAASLSLAPPPHILIADHSHPAHPLAGLPASASEILDRVREVFTLSPENELRLDQLWRVEGIDILCGGLPRVLLDAFLQSPISSSSSQVTTSSSLPGELEWELTQGSPSDLLSWLVLWRNWVPPPPLPDSETWDGTIEEDEYVDWPVSNNHDDDGDEGDEWSAHPVTADVDAEMHIHPSSAAIVDWDTPTPGDTPPLDPSADSSSAWGPSSPFSASGWDDPDDVADHDEEDVTAASKATADILVKDLWGWGSAADTDSPVPVLVVAEPSPS